MTFAHTHAHRSDPATSHEAARTAQGMAERHKHIICAALFWRGLTSQEISNMCELNYHQVARRISDLKRDGKVQDSGETRRSPGGRRATVWELAPQPRKERVAYRGVAEWNHR